MLCTSSKWHCEKWEQLSECGYLNMCSKSAKQVRAEGTTKQTNLRNQGRHAGWRGVTRLEAADRDIFVGVSGLYTGESRSARRMN